MKQEVALAPDVILEPVSFSMNLITFCNDGKKVGIPLAWLWEEIDARIGDQYGLISTADILASSSKYIPYDERIWFSQEQIELGAIDDFSKFTISMDILKAAYESGYIEAFITEYDKWYFEHGDWVGYLLNIVPKYKVIPFDEAMIHNIDSICSKAISGKYSLDEARLNSIIKRNEKWSTRVASEYPIYEDFRRLNIEIGQIFSACFNKYAISSSREHVRNTVVRRLGSEFKQIHTKSDNDVFPFLEIITISPHEFTIGDIVKIIDNRSLLDKFGSIRAAIEKINEIHERNEYKKNLLVYVLGWVPVVDIPVKIFEGAELILKKIGSINRRDKSSCIYFDVNKWKKNYEKVFRPRGSKVRSQ
jgi:hypothetical protein